MAALSDLKSEKFKEIFCHLEKEQTEFLSKEYQFRSDEYKWPRDPLHDFSRVWEYPFVYYHLATYLKDVSGKERPKVVDVGSGVTFFPFALSRLGYQVVCADIDPICERDLGLACQAVSQDPGSVDFKLIVGDNLPFENSSCDFIYCISVLEHIPNFEKTLSEMARILKTGGVCIITCDINLQSECGAQLNSTQYEQLLAFVNDYFEWVHPERTVHPLDFLTTRNSPYPRRVLTMGFFSLSWQILKQRVIKPLLGRKPGQVNVLSPHLGVFGMVLRKRV